MVDVSDASAVESLAGQVFQKDGKCHILMNNAGIGLGGGAMMDMDTVQKVLGVNTYGPIYGCLAFVPRMKASQEPGYVINTGSTGYYHASRKFNLQHVQSRPQSVH